MTQCANYAGCEALTPLACDYHTAGTCRSLDLTKCWLCKARDVVSGCDAHEN